MQNGIRCSYIRSQRQRLQISPVEIESIGVLLELRSPHASSLARVFARFSDSEYRWQLIPTRALPACQPAASASGRVFAGQPHSMRRTPTACRPKKMMIAPEYCEDLQPRHQILATALEQRDLHRQSHADPARYTIFSILAPDRRFSADQLPLEGALRARHGGCADDHRGSTNGNRRPTGSLVRCRGDLQALDAWTGTLLSKPATGTPHRRSHRPAGLRPHMRSLSSFSKHAGDPPWHTDSGRSRRLPHRLQGSFSTPWTVDLQLFCFREAP